MSQTFRVHALPLVKRMVRETDRVYSVLTEDRGKLELFAKGSRKIVSKLAGNMEEVGVLDLFVIRGRTFDRLGGVETLVSYNNIRESFERQFAVLNTAAFLDRALRPGERDHTIFELFHEYLQTIAGASPQALADGRVTLAMQWKMFARLGFRPDLERCVRCRSYTKEAAPALTVRYGGVLCEACRTSHVVLDALPFSPDARKVLNFLLEAPLAETSRLFLAPALHSMTHALSRSWALTHLDMEPILA